MSSTLPARRTFTVASLCIGAVLLLAGCSSSSSSSGTTAASTSTTAASGSGATTTTAQTSGSTTSGSGKVPSTCPTPAQLAPTAGTTLPTPQTKNTGGTLVCTYNDPNTGANVVVEFTTSPHLSASDLATAAASQAKAENVTAIPLPGLGKAAFIFTQNDASQNVNRQATTGIVVLKDGVIIGLEAELPVANTKAVATYLTGLV